MSALRNACISVNSRLKPPMLPVDVERAIRRVDIAVARPASRRYDSSHNPIHATMLITCVVYANGRKLADISVEDISEYVTRPDCFVWVALFEPTREELDQMAEEFDLHPLAVED